MPVLAWHLRSLACNLKTNTSSSKWFLFNPLWPRQNGCHFTDAIFSWMKMFILRLKFHWSLFLRVLLTILQRWFRYWRGTIQETSHYLNQWWLVNQHIYGSLGLNELTYWGLNEIGWHFADKSYMHFIDWKHLKLYWCFNKCVPGDVIGDKSTLVEVMAWCHQAPSHCLYQCWHRFIMPYGITKTQWVKADGTIVMNEMRGAEDFVTK